MIRRTAGAITAVIGLIIVLPVLVQGLPAKWRNAIDKYLPSIAGEAIIGRTKFTPPDHPSCHWKRAHAALCLLLLRRAGSSRRGL